MRLEQGRRAEADLDGIRDYSLQRFGIARAIRYLDMIEEAFRRILAYPEIGERDDRFDRAIRSLSCEQHRIFYEIDGEVVRILRILHQAMDVARHL